MAMSPLLKLILVFLSSFLLSLSSPGYNIWIFAWFFLSPLFIIINSCEKLKEILFYSFLFGFSYNLFCLQWLFSLHPLTWLGFNENQSILISSLSLFIVSFYNSLFFILFALVIYFLKKLLNRPLNKTVGDYLIITFVWLVVFNKISSSEFLSGFPWTLVEYSQYKNLFLIQIAEYLGSTSISFLIVFFNLVFANFLSLLFNIQKIGDRYVPKEPGQFQSIIFGTSFIVILISLSLVYGVFSFAASQETFSNASQSVCLLQGNLPIKATRGNNLDINLSKKNYSDLINRNNASLFILPEGALPSIYNLDLNTKIWLKNNSQGKEANIISGTYCKTNNKLKNCAVLYSHIKKVNLYYEKQRLVPFGEFTPLSFLLPSFLKKLASNIIGEGFTKGSQNLPLETSIGKAGVNICFELIFPTIIRKQSLQGANFLINLSDLSWFSNDIIRNQFLAFGVFRAIENGKPVIIATNSGISAFIEPAGKIKSLTLSNTEGVLLDWINPNNKITFYAKYGW